MYATSYGHARMNPGADIFGLDEYASHYLNGFNLPDDAGHEDDVWDNETKGDKHHYDVLLSDKHYHVLHKDLKDCLQGNALQHQYDEGQTRTPSAPGPMWADAPEESGIPWLSWATARHCYLTYLKVKNMLLNRQVPMFSDVIKLVPHAVLAYDRTSGLELHDVRRVQ
eukprot:7388303-Prymnesium_polylepis.1